MIRNDYPCKNCAHSAEDHHIEDFYSTCLFSNTDHNFVRYCPCNKYEADNLKYIQQTFKKLNRRRKNGHRAWTYWKENVIYFSIS